MNVADGAWFSFLIVMLFGLLFFLQIKFPNPSRTSETGVLLTLSIVFFLICGRFLSPHEAGAAKTPQFAGTGAKISTR